MTDQHATSHRLHFGTENIFIRFKGQCVGRISIEPKGDAGFDMTVFIPEAGDGRTFSEMDMTEKLDLSHRTMALKMMIQKLNFPSI